MHSTHADAYAIMLHNHRWLIRYRRIRLSYIYAAFLLLFLASTGMSAVEIFFLTAVSTGVSGASEIFTGHYADRYGQKPSLYIGCALSFVGFMTYGFVTSFGALALIAAAFVSLGASFCYGPDSTLAHDSAAAAVGEEQALEFECKANAAGAYAEAFVSLFLGTLLVWWFGLRSVMFAQALTFVILMPIIWQLKPVSSVADAVVARPLRVILWHTAARPHLLFHFAYAAAISNLSFIMVWLAQPYFAAIHFGSFYLPTWSYGVAASYLLLTTWLWRKYFHQFTGRWQAYGTLGALLIVGGASYLLVGVAALGCCASLDGAALAIVAMVLMMPGFFFVRTIQLPLMTFNVNMMAEHGERSTIQSLQRSGQLISYSVLALITGAVIDRTSSLGLGILTSGVLTVGCGALAFAGLLRTRHEEKLTLPEAKT